MEISKSCKESKERKTGQIISMLVGSGLTMRGLNNTSSSHSGLDPESPKHLITLDTGLRRYGDIAGYAGFGKALTISFSLQDFM